MLGLITVEPGEMGGISCSILGQLGEPKNLRRIPRRDRTKADSGGFGGNRWVTAGHKRAAADVGETLHSSGDDAEARNWSQYVANLRGPVTLFSTLSGGFGRSDLGSGCPNSGGVRVLVRVIEIGRNPAGR